MARMKDIRSKTPNVDLRRRARFHVGWKHAANGRIYEERTGEITWASCGNRWGARFGMRPLAERNLTYDLLVELRIAIDDD